MAETDGEERTEDPSARRRQEALDEGNVPRSMELTAAVGLLASAVALHGVGGAAMGNQFVRLLEESMRWLDARTLDAAGAQVLVLHVARAALLALLPFLGVTVAAVAGMGLLQGRGVISLAPLAPKLERISPQQGLKRLLGTQALFATGKAIVKFLVLALVTWMALAKAWPDVITLQRSSTVGILEVMHSLAYRLMLTAGLTFLVVALADYGFELWRHEQSLRMTKEEVKREARENEGNPEVKSRVRQLRDKMRRTRMLQAVKTADVVVTNPTHIAVALKYDGGRDAAPVVLAIGKDLLAERIKQLARDAQVPLVENKPLARALLATAKLNRPIPLELYEAVAEVLAWVYRRRGWVPA